MAGFEPYARDAEALEHEMVVRGIMLGIDWNDPGAVHALARELASGGAAHIQALARDDDTRNRARGQLFAFAILMQQTMAESAAHGIHTHGGPVWKSFSRALMQAMESRGSEP